MATPSESELIAEIISEFSDAFAFSRTRWARFASEVSAEISGVSMLVMQVVLRKGPITATGVGQLLDMDKSLVSRQVAKLRELGLIEAAAAADDKRVYLLTASDRAIELIENIRERWTTSYRERFEGWSGAELDTLRAGLHRFNAAVDASGTEGPAARCSRQAGEAPAEASAG